LANLQKKSSKINKTLFSCQPRKDEIKCKLTFLIAPVTFTLEIRIFG
jgi:hypothetical protein